MPETPAVEPRPLSLGWALVPIVSLVALLALSYYLFGDGAAGGPNQIALLFSALIALYVGRRHGHGMPSLSEAAVASVTTGVGAIFILLAVGALIGTWAMSGTLITMVYYGLQLLSPDYFLVTSCVICALVAFSIGSSWTVAGTIGIGLMGIAQQMDVSPAMTAGAVISGAYFGDKASPLSDSANLACAAAGASIYDHIRESLWTSLPALGIALAIFFMLGSSGGEFDASGALGAIEAEFAPSPLYLAPLVLVLALAILRWPPFVSIFLGALAGGLLAAFSTPEHVVAFADPSGELPEALALVKGAWLALATGFVSTTGMPAADTLLSRGGMGSMLTTIWLILVALAFGGIVEKAGILDRLIGPVVRAAKRAVSLVGTLVAAAVSTNVLAADQYIAIVLPGRMMRSAFEERGYAPVVLSRAIGDSATVTSPLIPWNSCGAYMAATLGVATTSFAPFCFFNMLNPLMTLVFAAFGIRMLKSGAAPAAASDEVEEKQT